MLPCNFEDLSLLKFGTRVCQSTGTYSAPSLVILPKIGHLFRGAVFPAAWFGSITPSPGEDEPLLLLPHTPGPTESRGSIVPRRQHQTHLHRQVVGHGEARHGRQRAVCVRERRVRSAQHGT